MLIPLLSQAGEPTIFDQIMAEVAPENGSLSFLEISLRLGAAVLVGWVLGLGYRLSYTGKKLKPTMHHTLVMLCLGGAFVWLVVGNNLVRAFGLAGTIGLIRYRTTLRDPKDTTVLFFAMVMGMAIGLGHIDKAILGCLFVFGALLIMRLTYTTPPPKQKEAAGDPTTDEPPHGPGEPNPPSEAGQ